MLPELPTTISSEESLSAVLYFQLKLKKETYSHLVETIQNLRNWTLILFDNIKTTREMKASPYHQRTEVQGKAINTR